MTAAARPPWVALLGSSLLGRAAGAICGLSLQIAIARMLGVDAFGMIYAGITIIMLAGILAKFGLDTDLLRRAGADWHAGRIEALASAYGSALTTVSLAGLVGSALLLVFAAPLSSLLFGSTDGRDLLRALALSVPVYGVVCVQASMLKAMDRPAAAAMLELALVPIGTVGVCLLIHFGAGLDARGVGWAHLSGTVLAAMAGAWWIRLPLRPLTRGLLQPRTARGGRNLAGIEVLNFALASAALPLVSAFAGADEAGLFNAANRLATQVGLVGLLVGGVLAPRFAALHENSKQHTELGRLSQQGTLMMTALALPLIALLLIWPQGALLLFGNEFSGLETPLRILALGQLVNMLTGPAGFLLVMTGYERDLRDILIMTVALSLPLTIGLAVLYGAEGAAWATTANMAMQNVAAASRIHKRLGFSMLPDVRVLPIGRTRPPEP